MRKPGIVLSCLLLSCAVATASHAEVNMPHGLVTVLVDLGSKQRTETKWDGSVTVTEGKLERIESWNNDPRDVIEGDHWTLSTHHRVPRMSNERQRGYENMPLVDGALLITISGARDDTKLAFTTAEGNFTTTIGQLPLGSTTNFLKGLVHVSQIGTATEIVSGPTEDDFPAAAAAADGSVYVAYTAFTHGKGMDNRGQLTEAPKDLSFLAEPTGGDQVLLTRLANGKWSTPTPVTPGGGDIYKTAIAVDGEGGVWVFWSENQGGNFDIYARRSKGGQWSAPLRITDAPESDFDVVATTAPNGRVWIAWQGFRGSNSNIFAVQQEGDHFSDAMEVAATPANEWAPAIAASRNGDIAVAWDTYGKGDYDVYCRTWSNGQWGAPVPVATSPSGELRVTCAYDRDGRLWLAYEVTPVEWGKDFGYLVKDKGASLYNARQAAVRVLDHGRLYDPTGDLEAAFYPGARGGKNRARRNWAKVAVPRIYSDASGRIWLAGRLTRMGERAPVGSTWLEFVTTYTGSDWAPAALCPGTDGLLDNRPPLLSLPGENGLLLISSADHRQQAASQLPFWLVRELRRKGEEIPFTKRGGRSQEVNSDLYAIAFPAPADSVQAPDLTPVTAEVGSPSAETDQERAAVAQMRELRATVDGQEGRIFRGDMHRHTEISPDGAGDGMLTDFLRYALDMVSFDWIMDPDHDNGNDREYSWWMIQQTTDVFHVGDSFVSMFGYERSVNYPDGHRNVLFAKRGIRTLPRLQGGFGKPMDDNPDAPRPHSPDTQLLYRYLEFFGGICSSHTSATDMGTDWRDYNPDVEPVVEIYQGCRQSYERPGAPRSNTEKDSNGGWRPLGFISRALAKGYRIGFQASSDHVSTHISYASIWVTQPTREGIIDAIRKRHCFGATDNLAAEVFCTAADGKERFMGDEFPVNQPPKLHVRLFGTKPFTNVVIVKDNEYVYTGNPGKADVDFTWEDAQPKAGTSYYYVRGEQADGQVVWASPMWITYKS